MKKLMFIAVTAAFILMDVTASAQFVQSTGRSSGVSAADAEPVFNTVDVTYSPVSYTVSAGEDSSNTDMTGISINWSQARLITNQLPLYIQYGAGLQYSWLTESESDDYYDVTVTSTISFLTVKIPVNVAYNFAIPNTAVAVMPYLGLNANIHILGQNKYTASYEGESESSTTNFFNEDDMGDGTYNRFVLGWQVGATVSYDRYFFGIGYAGPITNLYKEGSFKLNNSQVNISLGIKF